MGEDGADYEGVTFPFVTWPRTKNKNNQPPAGVTPITSSGFYFVVVASWTSLSSCKCFHSMRHSRPERKTLAPNREWAPRKLFFSRWWSKQIFSKRKKIKKLRVKYAGERKGNENRVSPEYDDLHVDPALVILSALSKSLRRWVWRVWGEEFKKNIFKTSVSVTNVKSTRRAHELRWKEAT